jgi:hypothetical protein
MLKARPTAIDFDVYQPRNPKEEKCPDGSTKRFPPLVIITRCIQC